MQLGTILKGGSKHLRHSEYTIYTDGSKNEEGIGRGFVVKSLQKNHSQCFKMQDHATVYQAELETVHQAYRYMDEKSSNLKSILTDTHNCFFIFTYLHLYCSFSGYIKYEYDSNGCRGMYNIRDTLLPF